MTDQAPMAMKEAMDYLDGGWEIVVTTFQGEFSSASINGRTIRKQTFDALMRRSAIAPVTRTPHAVYYARSNEGKAT